VILSNVDLRVYRNNRAPQTCSDKQRNGKYRFQSSTLEITAPALSCKRQGPCDAPRRQQIQCQKIEAVLETS
jgi:hypothetical protein